MGSISKEAEKRIINKTIELTYEGLSSAETTRRLYDFSAGLCGGAKFIDVYVCIKRAIFTVMTVLEELQGEQNVEFENSVQKAGQSDSGKLVESDNIFTADEITRLP